MSPIKIGGGKILWARSMALPLIFIALGLGWSESFTSIKHSQGQENSTTNSEIVSQIGSGPESTDLKIRRLFVPEDRLVEFMRDRPAFLPLSSAKFAEILAAAQQKQIPISRAEPLRHWLTILPGGGIQGFSLVRSRTVRDSDSLAEEANAGWLSFDDWKIPADYFNLVPKTTAALDYSDSNSGMAWPTNIEAVAEYSEVPVALSINEQGSFGMPLNQAEPWMLVRYNLTLATQTDSNAHRQIQLPNCPSTITFIKDRTNNPFQFLINGWLQPISRCATPDETNSAEAFVYRQAICDSTNLIGQFIGPDSATHPLRVEGRYVEHSTVTLNRTTTRYETVISLDFREPVQSDLTLEVPHGVELLACEVNGTVRPFKLAATDSNHLSLTLPWQVWGLSNQIRLVGTLPPVHNGRTVVPRVSLPGHAWTVGNVQVRIEAPLSLKNYELIDSRLVRCQELGETQSLSFQWGSPEAQVAVLVDLSSANSVFGKPSPPDIVLVTANQESLEAEQYLMPDLRFNDSNVSAFEVGSQWQIEQIASFDPRQAASNPADRVSESNLTPLPWLLSIRDDRQVVLVTMPNEVGTGSLGLRVRAVRPVTQWPVDIDCRVLRAISNASLATANPDTLAKAPRPCLVSLRGTAGIRADSLGPLRWTVLANDEARLQAAELAGTLGAGNFQFSPDQSILTLQNNTALTGSYEALAYTRNHVQDSGMVHQVHRLLIQPSGPVYEIEVASSHSPHTAGQWQVFDEKNQAIPFELNPAAEKDRWRVRFNQPLNGATSILIEQQWQAEVTGKLLVFSTPKARSFAGVVDTHALGTHGFHVSTKSGAVDERLAASLRAYRDNSRSWFFERHVVGPSENLTRLASEREPSGLPTRSAVTTDTTSCVFSSPNDVEYSRTHERTGWNSVVVSQATQLDTWRRDGWSTRLTLSAYCENSGLVDLDLPTNARVQQVRVNDAVVPVDYQSSTLRIPLSGTGVQSIQCLWQVPHEASLWMCTGLTSLPQRNPILELAENSDRLVCLPNDFSLVAAPKERSLLSYSLSRRLISPLIWPESWPISRGATSVTPSGWSRFRPTNQHETTHFRCWRQESGFAPNDRGEDLILVSDHRVFEASHWGVLLLGCVGMLFARLSCLRISPSRPGVVSWWIGGFCVMAAICVPWPYYFVASTMLLGLLLAGSWSNICQFLGGDGWQTTWTSDSRPGSKSANGVRTAPSSLWIGAIALGLGLSQTSGHDSLASTSVTSEHGSRYPQERSVPEGKPLTANSILPTPDDYQAVVVPVDAEQKPIANVVYLSPELYRTLTEQPQSTMAVNDLEVRNAQHTVEYDAQLERFFRLTTQYTCRTQSKRTYFLPSSTTGEHVIRQVRVNGVPVLFQRRSDRIAVPLENGTNILSIAYDLQSTKTSLELATLGTSESYVVLNGVPNGLQAVAIDQDNPQQRFRSSIQRRFRIDRIKRLLVEVNRQSNEGVPPSVETWLSIQPQQTQCELRMTLGPALKYRSEWLFQVDPRLVLPTGFQSSSSTWSLDRLPEVQRPTNAKSGPVYRLLFSKDHPPHETITIPWEYRERSFGVVIPPQIEILHPMDTQVRNWLVLRVAEGLVYRTAELARTNYRRANMIEVENARAAQTSRETDPGSTARTPSAESVETIKPNLSNVFVYEVTPSVKEGPHPILGKLSLQPTQVSGTLRQDVQLRETSATITMDGELKVSHGELGQLPFRLPSGTKIQSLVITTAQQNEVAWTIQQRLATSDEVMVLLRSPLNGTLKFNMTADVPLGVQGSVRLPWARFLPPLEVNQTLQIQDSSSIWQLPTSNENLGALQAPQTFVVATDSADNIDQLFLVRSPNMGETSEPAAIGRPALSPNETGSVNPVDLVTSVSQTAESDSAAVEVLASRLVLVRSTGNSQTKGSHTETPGQVEALLQILLRNHRQSSAMVRVPVEATVLRGWVDQNPAIATLLPTSNQPPPIENNDNASDLVSVADASTGRTLRLSLDPLEDYSLITLQVLWQSAAEQMAFSLPEIVAEGKVPVHLSGFRGTTCPEDLLRQATPLAPESSFNVQEVLARKTTDWNQEDLGRGWPAGHPLVKMAEEPWPDAGNWLLPGMSTKINTIAEPGLPPNELAGEPIWGWFLVVSLFISIWFLGAFWPRFVPNPVVWGDFGWLIVAGGVWLAGGQVWLLTLLLLLGLSFLVCRILRLRFSWRFA
ncbi:MAG: hypothetical protein JNL67_15515 [Planctomycetaceae bacterium]|nr:hypothetical protein [Planctomycetaceae bacterium]